MSGWLYCLSMKVMTTVSYSYMYSFFSYIIIITHVVSIIKLTKKDLVTVNPEILAVIIIVLLNYMCM